MNTIESGASYWMLLQLWCVLFGVPENENFTAIRYLDTIPCMKWLLIVVIAFGLMAYGVYYSVTGDKRAHYANAGPKEQKITITIGGDQQVEDLIAAGKYDRVDDPISDATLPTGQTDPVAVDLTLLKLHYDFHSKEQALVALEAKGLVPARIEHVLALGAQHPEFYVYNDGAIIFLGSTFKNTDGKDQVPARDVVFSQELRLLHIEDPLLVGPDDWIAGVKK